MEQIKIDLNDVIEALSAQVSSLSKDNAYNVAVIQANKKRIKELEEEVENLRKAQIAEMDGDSSK